MSLALTKLFLNKIGAGICRVHGGGFAGVIMCVLPIENADAYVDYMAQYVGRGKCLSDEYQEYRGCSC